MGTILGLQKISRNRQEVIKNNCRLYVKPYPSLYYRKRNPLKSYITNTWLVVHKIYYNDKKETFYIIILKHGERFYFKIRKSYLEQLIIRANRKKYYHIVEIESVLNRLFTIFLENSEESDEIHFTVDGYHGKKMKIYYYKSLYHKIVLDMGTASQRRHDYEPSTHYVLDYAQRLYDEIADNINYNTKVPLNLGEIGAISEHFNSLN